MALDIRVEQEKQKGIIKIHLGNSLDGNTASLLDSHIHEIETAPPALLVLDMKELNYISSAGIRSVMKALKVMKSSGGRLIIANRQPQIVKVFDIMLSLPDFKVFASDTELDRYLDKMQAKTRSSSG